MKKYQSDLLIIGLSGILCVVLDALLRVFTSMRLISPRAVMFSFAYGILVSSFVCFFKKKQSKCIYLTVMMLFLATLAFSQSMYYSFFSDFYSFTRLSNLKEFFVVKGETAKAFEMKYLLYYGVTVVYLLGVFAVTKHNEKRKPLIGGTVFAMGIAMIFGIKLTFINEMSDPTQLYLTDDYLYSTLYNKSSAMERFGVFSYSQRDLFRIVKNSLNLRDQEDMNAINEYFDSHQRERIENEKTGIFEGKNVVLILAESLNTWGIDEKITPNLYRMKTEGYYFSNYFSPTFPSTTIDAEFAVNTGLIPSLDFGNTAYMFSDNSYPQSMANLFKEQGYTALSFHNSIGSFYNRFQYHEALGYDHFYDSDELGIEVPENFGYNWANDKELFDVAADILLEKNDQPFFAYLITVATHTPYDEGRTGLQGDYEQIKEIVDADSQVQYYLAAAKNLDEGIGLMMDRFEEQGILEDTVFVLFSDHYSYGMYHDIIWSYYTEYAGDFHRIHNVPFMIWTPGMEDGEMVENACSQFEVLPTVANLFNLNVDPTFLAGNDIFNDQENLIVYGKRSSWQDENVIYENNMIYEYLNKEADVSYVENRNAEIIEKLDLYQKVLQQNYFDTSDFEERRKGTTE